MEKHFALLDSLRVNDTSETAIAGPLAATPALLASYKDSLAVMNTEAIADLIIARSYDSTLTLVTWDNGSGDHPIPETATLAIMGQPGRHTTSMVPEPPCLSTYAEICPTFYYFEIYPLGGALYLAVGSGKEPGPYPLRVISAFRVEAGRLERADIFPVLDSGDKANLFFEYDPRAAKGEDPEFKVSGDTVLYPVITATPDGAGFDGRYKTLVFDGVRFTLSSAAKGYTSSRSRP
ncbi:MAG TPA: hypothetical protein VL547_05235 [Dinghuibacter sp.]|uniref:hypothetical protein n=1 Tax=Dinghuibacter sp. TaxID=2024697 RepID=UPI002B86EAFF|nr:hypothetical protein [Dinghuibacter sp.]HTJ11401.1 hypothetical protein [Dinghuibacter sp.]